MTTPRHDENIPHSMTREGWNERYSGDRVWSGHPNGALVSEAATLAPGRALDVGCGEGADAVWLARQGWQVTALDIAERAVERTLAAAEAAQVEVTGVVSAFLDADLTGTFELVSCQYPVLDRTPDHHVERRLADLVAPGGTLLFVHHDPTDEGLRHARENGFDPDSLLAPPDVAAWFAAQNGWRIITDERRERHVTDGAGAGISLDLVVRVERTA